MPIFYSLRFRLLVRALCAFVALQASTLESRSNLVSLDSDQHRGSLLYRQFQTSFKFLEQTKTNKQYNDLKEHIYFGINFIHDATHQLKDYNVLLSYYIKALFTDKYCLKLIIDEMSVIG